MWTFHELRLVHETLGRHRHAQVRASIHNNHYNDRALYRIYEALSFNINIIMAIRNLKPSNHPSTMLKIIYQPSLDLLLPLRNDEMPGIVPFLQYDLKAPNLIGQPTALFTNHITLHLLALWVFPILLEPLFVQLPNTHPPRSALDGSKNVIRVGSVRPIEGSLFFRARSAGCSFLDDVNVSLVAVFGGSNIFGYVEVYSTQAYSLPDEPRDALLVGRRGGVVSTMIIGYF